MLEFESQAAFVIAERIELAGPQSYLWMAVLSYSEDAIESLRQDLSTLVEGGVRILTAGAHELDHLRALLNEPPSDVALLLGFEQWDQDAWRALDINRSWLERPGALLFFLKPASFAALSRHAPNIRSYIGGSVFLLSTANGLMTEEDCRERLVDLATHFRLTNEQIVRMAQEHALPPDPEYVEWLVLLGRGDLI